jgi:hypothetical protein
MAQPNNWQDSVTQFMTQQVQLNDHVDRKLTNTASWQSVVGQELTRLGDRITALEQHAPIVWGSQPIQPQPLLNELQYVIGTYGMQ